MYFKFKNCNIIEFYEGNPFRAGGCVTCEDGYKVNSEKTGCVPCPDGSAGTDGTCNPCGNGNQPNGEKTGCVPCPDGSAGTDGTCTTCDSGKQPNSSKTDCELCPAGTAGTNGTCNPCNGNKYSTGGATSCLTCDTNGYRVNSSNTACKSLMTIACGYAHTMFLTNEGKVYGCGHNNFNEINNSRVYTVENPILITVTGLEANDKVNKIACGKYHTMFLTEGGKVYGCGKNEFYQVNSSGGSSGSTVQTPSKITGLEVGDKVTKIACGDKHTMFLTERGKVWGCGHNYDYQVNSDGGKLKNPTLVTGLEANDKIVDISCGFDYTMFLTERGKVWGCGLNENYQVNSRGGNSDNNVQTPTLVTKFDELISGNDKIIQIACGDKHTMFLTSEGKVYGCGFNENYQVNSSGGRVQNPTLVTFTDLEAGDKVTKIACGYAHTMFLTERGKVYGGGNNTYYQVNSSGGSSGSTVQTPSKITDLPTNEAITEIACGGNYTIFSTSSGKVYGCGENNDYQNGIDSTDVVNVTSIISREVVKNKNSITIPT